jgi:hypothetical protein
MNTAVTTIIAAGIAVLGTLLSPILVQYATARAKAQEYELARRQRQEEREAEAQNNKYLELRRAYSELNTEMRGFLRALTNYMHLIRSHQCSQEARDDLNQVREKYLNCYADAQMMVSDNVFVAAADANNGLSRLYGMALRLDGFTVPSLPSAGVSDEDEEESIETAFAYLAEVRPLIWKLRNTMRRELGVGSAEV